MTIESTGHKPTDRERSIAAIETVLRRIEKEVAAALIAVQELRETKIHN